MDTESVAEPAVTGVSLIVVGVKHLDVPGRVAVDLLGVAGPINPEPRVVGQVLKDFGAGLLRAAGVPALAGPDGSPLG